MKRKRSILALTGLVVLVGLVGCGVKPRAPEAPLPKTGLPRPGSKVMPRLYLAEPWTCGQTTPIHIRLEVQGQGDKPHFLKILDVAEDQLPHVELTFFHGKEPIKDREDLKTKHDC